MTFIGKDSKEYTINDKVEIYDGMDGWFEGERFATVIKRHSTKKHVLYVRLEKSQRLVCANPAKLSKIII